MLSWINSTIAAYFISLILLFLFPNDVFASFGFTDNQSTIDEDQEIDLDVTLSVQGQEETTYYIEDAFTKSGQTKYFGLTWNGNSWVNYVSSTGYNNLLQITTDQSGRWEGIIKVKLDTASSNYQGPGSYLLRLKRFTSSGNSNFWSDSDNDQTLTVTATAPTATNSPPTATPTAFVTPNPTSTPTKTPAAFTQTVSQNSIQTDEVLSTSVILSNFTANTTYYLKGAFIKDGSTNYFGQTQINDSWINNSSSYSSQLPITTDSAGYWQGIIKVMPDTEDSGFNGSDNYLFKIARYDSFGNGPTWSNQSSIYIAQTPDPTQDIDTPTSLPTVTIFQSSQNLKKTESSILGAAATPAAKKILLLSPPTASPSSVSSKLTFKETSGSATRSSPIKYLLLSVGSLVILLSSFLAYSIKKQ